MATATTKEKAPKKYVWILVILPIGLLVGTITSLVQHLRKDSQAQDQQQFQSPTSLNAADIRKSMQASLLLGKRETTSIPGRKHLTTTRRFIEGDVSPAGTGHQFISKPMLSIDGQTIPLSYVDLPGKKPKNIIAIIIELPGESGKGDSAKLSITPALIHALTQHNGSHTLRFVLSPITADADTHYQHLKRLTLSSDERLLSTIVLKLCDLLPLDAELQWMLSDGSSPSLQQSLAAHLNADSPLNLAITHPVLMRRTNMPIADRDADDCLIAAEQLRKLLLDLAQ